MSNSTTAVADLDRQLDSASALARHGRVTTAPAVPTLVPADGTVVALRRRPAVAPGGLADRLTVAGSRLVTAYDLEDGPWWIPAEAVWSDADESPCPSTPRPTGLATANSRERALLAGLSDRLGWEAMVEFERSRDLSLIDTSTFQMDVRTDGVAVLDGRVGLDIPTVVVIGEDVLRWGAGVTWDVAIERAMYRHAGSIPPEEELAELSRRLRSQGLAIASVDLGSPVLRQADVHRHSVQLLHV